ncbi:hypothetical protein ACFP3I_08810 [Chryseobacterium arachidis]
MTKTLAPIATASFCVAKRNKRYSGKRETASKEFRQIQYVKH